MEDNIKDPLASGTISGSGTGEREHSQFSPSKLKQLEISPRFIPDTLREAHPLTLEGTLIHQALETLDQSRLNEEQKVWATKCFNYTVAIKGKVFRELRLDILPDVWGFADLVVLNDKRADLIDYKFGLSAQEPVETNPAAQAYTAGILKKWPSVTEVEVHYLYPKLDTIDRCAYTRSDLPILELRIETIIARAKAATSCNPSSETCPYCARKANCPDLHAWALPIAQRYSERKKLAAIEAYDPKNISDPVVMGRALLAAHILGDWVESVKRHALLMRQESGQEIPGWSLASRSGKKTINNPQIAYEIVIKNGIGHEQFLRAVDVSMKRLADVAKESAGQGQKAKAATAIENRLRDAGVLEIGEDIFYLARAKS
jgi:hypothetical protein